MLKLAFLQLSADLPHLHIFKCEYYSEELIFIYFFCKLDRSNMTLRVTKGTIELPGWADNIDFDQDYGKEKYGEEKNSKRRNRSRLSARHQTFLSFSDQNYHLRWEREF